MLERMVNEVEIDPLHHHFVGSDALGEVNRVAVGVSGALEEAFDGLFAADFGEFRALFVLLFHTTKVTINALTRKKPENVGQIN